MKKFLMTFLLMLISLGNNIMRLEVINSPLYTLPHFNYFSIWIFICFFLQGLFSYKIIYHYTKDNFYSLFVTLFFLTAPIFLPAAQLSLTVRPGITT